MANEELKHIIEEGYFGEKVVLLLQKVESYEDKHQLYEIIKDWIEGDELKFFTKTYMLFMLKVILESFETNPNQTYEEISTFITGSRKDPRKEKLSTILEFQLLSTETQKKVSTLNSKSSIGDIRNVTSSISNNYSKGIEFIGKIIPLFICLVKIRNQEEYNMYKIEKLNLHKKLIEFDACTSYEYKIITNMINRDIRNAEAHLSLIYSDKRKKYVLRKIVNGKYQNEYIKPIDL
ncbi:hypothetical protein CHH57_02115, partial [Niallia circulans]